MPRAVAVAKESSDEESTIEGFSQNVRNLISFNETEERSAAGNHSRGEQIDPALIRCAGRLVVATGLASLELELIEDQVAALCGYAWQPHGAGSSIAGAGLGISI
jgi:hypothetical protein